MKRLNQMIGLPVTCGERRLGVVASLCLSPDARQLTGMNLRRAFRGCVFIPGAHIRALADEQIEITPAAVQKAQKATRLGAACDGKGFKLGLITDAAIEERSLRVEALEISFGPLDDLMRGRCWFRRFTVDPVTGEVVVSVEEKEGVSKLERGRPS